MLPLVPHECTASAPNAPNSLSSCCEKKIDKCGENEGECHNDDDCKAGLKCGQSNCPPGFPSAGSDCCYEGIV